MADFIAGLPGFIGYSIGAGIVLLAITRVVLAAANKMSKSASGLLLIDGGSVAAVIGILTLGPPYDFGRHVSANLLAGLCIFLWDRSRLGRAPASSSTGSSR